MPGDLGLGDIRFDDEDIVLDDAVVTDAGQLDPRILVGCQRQEAEAGRDDLDLVGRPALDLGEQILAR